MAEIKWIKLTTTMFDDEKIRLIRKMPEADAILLTWIQLLVQAGKANASGNIVLSETIPYTDEMLSAIFDRPINIIRLALQTFQQFGMVDIEGGVISISNWEKHQNIDGMEKIKEQNRLRKQKQRDKQKLLPESHVTSHGTVTQSHATDIDKELDLDKEKDTTTAEANPFNFYEQNGFGRLNPAITEYINEWIDGNYFDEPKLIIIKAMEEAVRSNVMNWNYVDKVLINWDQKNLRTLIQVNAFLIQHKNATKPTSRVKTPTRLNKSELMEEKARKLIEKYGGLNG